MKNSGLSQYLDRLQRIRVWTRGMSRAPHKPLYLLLCYSRVQKGLPRLHSFSEIERQLGELLLRYAPRSKSVHAEYPFWRIQSDGLGVVESDGAALIKRKSNSDPTVRSLRHEKVHGGLPKEDFELLMSSSRILIIASQYLLDKHFPASIHADICGDIGLDIGMAGVCEPAVPRAITDEVMSAYGMKCAITQDAIYFKSQPVGLELAHICWWETDRIPFRNNVIPMCSLMHKLYDRGVFTVENDYRISIASEADILGGCGPILRALQNIRIFVPALREMRPAGEALSWHQRNVFRG
jgi:putative restriction endonuclease